MVENYIPLNGSDDVVEVYDELGSTNSSGFHATAANIMDKGEVAINNNLQKILNKQQQYNDIMAEIQTQKA